MPGRSLTETNVHAAPEADPTFEVISPELVLVDPELAQKARALLPWPAPTFPPRRPVPVAVSPDGAAATPLPARPAPAPDVSHAPTSPHPQEAVRLHFGRRLGAVAALLPALVALAMFAEFVGRSGSPRGATVPGSRSTSAVKGRDRSDQGGVASKTTGKTQGRRRSEASGGPRLPGNRIEELAGEIGRRAGAVTTAYAVRPRLTRDGEYCNANWSGQGLTLVLVGRGRENPCVSGRVVGGFATLPRWRTSRRISVGSSLAELRHRYPNASFVGSGWWMLGMIRAAGSKKAIPLHAHVSGGRVDRILVD